MPQERLDLLRIPEVRCRSHDCRAGHRDRYVGHWRALSLCLGYPRLLPELSPVSGGITGTLGVAAVAVVHFDNLYYGMLAPLAYQTLTSLEGKFLTPMFLGAQLQLNVVAVFLTVIFWTWLWSIPGALMAVPILVLIKVICDNVPDLAVFGNFQGERAIEPVASGRPVRHRPR